MRGGVDEQIVVLVYSVDGHHKKKKIQNTDRHENANNVPQQ